MQGEGRCPGEGDDRIGVAVRESTETYVVVKTVRTSDKGPSEKRTASISRKDSS